MHPRPLLGLLINAAVVLTKQLACNDRIPHPEYFGTEVTSLTAQEIHDYDDWGFFVDITGIPFEKNPLSFCNVTITYTHPGQGDNVNVYLWLPLKDWNGNFLAQGGGGWAAGNPGALAPAVARGYAAVQTDTGHSFFIDPIESGTSAASWALSSLGNVNWQLLQNFASISLDDMTGLGKAVVQTFYGRPAKYAYWNGCSTGGRQGLMQAQRYPGNYDGILAVAPAINWVSFVMAEQWAQVVMGREGYWPPGCEVAAITREAIAACDELDGVRDGVVAAAGLCQFDAESVVGKAFDCEGDEKKISKMAARIVNAAWEGVKRRETFEWFGLNHEAPLTYPTPLGGLLQTTCDADNKNCKGRPMPISMDWVQLFLAKNPERERKALTEEEFFKFLHQSRNEYTSIVDTADPDLSGFRAAGGKMITWHGLGDQLIFPNGTANYYERVLMQDPQAADYYRYFEAPGVEHCVGGPGAFPDTAFDRLVDWVEKGKQPDHLDAKTPTTKSGIAKTRLLCPYPEVAAYQGGDPDLSSSFGCAKGFGTKKAADWMRHHEL